MLSVTSVIEQSVGLNPVLQIKLMNSLAIIVMLWLIRTALLRLLWRRSGDVRTRYIWQKTATYIVVLLAIIMVGRLWFTGFQSLATFLGLVSAGIAIALKDPLTSIAGWVFILARRPFTLGDRIKIGENAGDVIDIRIFQFTLMEIGGWVDADQSTGRIIHIPNGKVFTETLANYSRGFQYIWNEVPVLVTFESNWTKAKDILQNIVRKHAEHLSASAEKRIKEANKKFMIFYTTLTPIVYTSVRDCGVLLTIRYLCEPRRRRSSENAIWEDILLEFATCGEIDFAYPTQRFYNNLLEGTSATKPSPDGYKEK